MALMFPRLARNFIKNGYFPTDEITLERLLLALAPPAQGTVRLLDPCAGEGVALAECRACLSTGTTAAISYGIEYDGERARHAKRLLDRCIKGSFFECTLGLRSFGLLFLNPPYGDKVADQAATGAERQGRQRMETDFLQRAVPHLQFGGVMVLIVPFHVLATEVGELVCRYFERVQIFLAPEQRFKQVVLLGIRKRAADRAAASVPLKAELDAIASGELPPVLPDVAWEQPYRVPASVGDGGVKFIYQPMEREQLAEEIARYRGLWPQFPLHFAAGESAHRPPLRALSPWHLALALAAGQVAGKVTAEDGRVYVIKGDTFKNKVITTQTEVEGDRVTEIRVATDQFVPTIRALDFTPGSPTFGEALTIR